MKLTEIAARPVEESLFSDAFAARQKRAKERLADHGVWLISVNKDGSESKMFTAKKHFVSVKDAIEHHNNMVKLNPGKRMVHNLHMDNSLGHYTLKLDGHHTRKNEGT
jgi:hypothetical protein